MNPPDESSPFPIESLEAFAAQLPRDAHVLCADEPVARWLEPRGISAQALAPDKDARFLSLPKASLHGIWLGDRLPRRAISIEDAQRVMAVCFQGLRSGGVIFATHAYSASGFASLLRQNGFQVVVEARSGDTTAIVARRI